ncbi:MAG: DUF1294 domain-containing protein [Planctomycetes bacterium]|nr:DUF1294 domain-containing protein [Planctomycetota bacterium]
MTRVHRWLTFASILWLMIAISLLVAVLIRKGIRLSAFFAIYLVLTIGCSIVAFVLYGVDKRKAVRDRPRISERTLHVIALIGGWPGAYLGSRVFRHKSSKMSFRVVSWVIVVIHLLILCYGIVVGSWWETFKAILFSTSASE